MAKSQKLPGTEAAASTNPALPNSDTKAGGPDSAPPGPDPRIGTQLGKYLITGRLGKGGMGVVYEAEDTSLKRQVALKLLPESLSSDSTLLERFLREAQAAARLSHANTVTIYEIGEHEGTRYIVMELVRGGSAEDSVRKRGAYDWREATRIVAEACRGLSAAHASGLIHRDIKPANIMCEAPPHSPPSEGGAMGGRVKLADFGLAKATDSTALSLTGSATVVGTPNYMSPEQCRSEKLDPRSDLYSLGATYFTLLTGRLPFQAEGPLEVMFAHCSNPVPNPRQIKPDVPEKCAAIVQRAMAKEPGDRYESAKEMFADLKGVLAPGTGGVRADQTGVAKKAPATVRVDKDVATPRTKRRNDELTTVVIPASKKRRQRRVPWLAIAGGSAIAVGVLVLVVAGLALSGRLKGPGAGNKNLQTSNEPDKTGDQNPLPNQNPPPNPVDNPPVPAATPRILVVIPFNNFWAADYDRVRRELDRQGAKVTVASSDKGLATPAPSPGGKGERVAVDLKLSEAKVADYDAVIFGGGTPQAVAEFMLDNRDGPTARKLIAEMQTAGKPIAAICNGPGILARAEALRGKRATCFVHVAQKITEHGGILVVDEAVVVDGNVVTGRDWNAAEKFVQAVLDLLKKSK